MGFCVLVYTVWPVFYLIFYTLYLPLPALCMISVWVPFCFLLLSFFLSSVSLKKKRKVLLILYACSRVSLLFSSYRFIRCIFLFFSLLVLFMLIACLMTPSRPTHLLTFNFYFSFCFSDTCCKCFPNGLRFTHGQLR